MYNKYSILLGIALFFATAVYAGVPVPPSDYTGSRSSANGITGTSPWSSIPGFNISWDITQTGSTFHYAYDLSVPSKDFSHAILELSSNITPSNINTEIFNFSVNGHSSPTPSPQLFKPTDPGNSNPGLPANIYGIKIDGNSTNLQFAFDSLRAPMWGDIYAKDGSSGGHFVYAYNTGFGTQPTNSTTDFSKWIAVPDTHHVNVPEPATYLLMLSGLGLAYMRRRHNLIATQA